jgi:hypothetical protein
MKKSGTPPRLTLVDPDLTPIRPPRPLGVHGQRLWDQVMAEYDVSDVAGIEFLVQAAAALDLAEALQERIAEDGPVIRTKTGLRAHPAIREQLAARSFVVRTLQRLGLNWEPTRVTSRSVAGRA